MKDGFVLYKSFYEPIEHLNAVEKGDLLDAIFKYQKDGTEPEKNTVIWPYFKFFQNQFRLDKAKYDKVCNRNKTNGLNGGRPKTQDNPNNPVGFSKPKKADKDKDKETITKKAFVAPSPEEVKEYFVDHGYTEQSAKIAHEYYTQRGWVDSKGKRVSNWKSKMVAVWFKDENKAKQKKMVW